MTTYMVWCSLMDKMIAAAEKMKAMVAAVSSEYIIICVSKWEYCSKLSHLGSQMKSCSTKSFLHTIFVSLWSMVTLDESFEAEKINKLL